MYCTGLSTSFIKILNEGIYFERAMFHASSKVWRLEETMATSRGWFKMLPKVHFHRRNFPLGTGTFPSEEEINVPIFWRFRNFRDEASNGKCGWCSMLAFSAANLQLQTGWFACSLWLWITRVEHPNRFYNWLTNNQWCSGFVIHFCRGHVTCVQIIWKPTIMHLIRRQTKLPNSPRTFPFLWRRKSQCSGGIFIPRKVPGFLCGKDKQQFICVFSFILSLRVKGCTKLWISNCFEYPLCHKLAQGPWQEGHT